MGCDSCTWTVNDKLYSCYIYTTNIHKWIQVSFKKYKKRSMILIQEMSVLLQQNRQTLITNESRSALNKVFF